MELFRKYRAEKSALGRATGTISAGGSGLGTCDQTLSSPKIMRRESRYPLFIHAFLNQRPLRPCGDCAVRRAGLPFLGYCGVYVAVTSRSSSFLPSSLLTNTSIFAEPTMPTGGARNSSPMYRCSFAGMRRQRCLSARSSGRSVDRWNTLSYEYGFDRGTYEADGRGSDSCFAESWGDQGRRPPHLLLLRQAGVHGEREGLGDAGKPVRRAHDPRVNQRVLDQLHL